MREYTSGSLDITATAVEPIHHGAGTSGNTQVLRLQSIILPDGNEARVPFVSGNSVKHLIRAHGAAYALDVMGIEDGTLSKAVVDLLFSGGQLTKGGGSVRLDRARKLADLFPILSVCGYSAGNWMEASKLTCHHLHLVCRENTWRIPASLSGHAHLRLYAGAMQEEEFGTRHEALRSQRAGRMLMDGATRDERKGDDLAKRHPDKGDSTQMIYDFQVVKPGSVFWGAVHFRDLRPMELAAFQSALAHACAGKRGDEHLFRLGAKSSVGFGLMAWLISGAVRIDEPEWLPTEALMQDSISKAYADHLRSRSAEIVSALEEAMR